MIEDGQVHTVRRDSDQRSAYLESRIATSIFEMAADTWEIQENGNEDLFLRGRVWKLPSRIPGR
jgi:hypothetical protein